MKKVARLRTSPTMTEDQHNLPPHLSNEPAVRTTGRIKKPKAVFDPSDNYLPRAQRLSAAIGGSGSGTNSPFDRRNSVSRLSTTSTDSSSVPTKEVCVVCGKRESKRTSFATKNPLITCVECECRIHRQCLKVDFEDFEQMRPKYKCERCIPCAICSKSGQAGGVGDDKKVLMCSKCTKAYHGQCLQPNTFKTDMENARNWNCPKCTLHTEITNGDSMPVKKIREIIGDQLPPAAVATTPPNTTPIAVVSATSSSSSSVFDNSHSSVDTSLKRSLGENGTGDEDNNPTDAKIAKPEDNEQDDKPQAQVSKQETPPHIVGIVQSSPISKELDIIPDVKNWSVQQVFEYFHQLFPKEAHVFKEHEIDGGSLLLLKRSDVVKKLPLKLGPSLRIFSTILQIQSQQVDPTLGWNCR